MEIVTQPGTALLLEPGGLDAPTEHDNKKEALSRRQLLSINGGLEINNF